MINCQNIIDFCLEYLEGGLPEDEHGRFERHLAVCGECVAFFETYRRTSEISRQALAAKMPTELKAAVHSYLRARCVGGTADAPVVKDE